MSTREHRGVTTRPGRQGDEDFEAFCARQVERAADRGSLIVRRYRKRINELPMPAVDIETRGRPQRDEMAPWIVFRVGEDA